VTTEHKLALLNAHASDMAVLEAETYARSVLKAAKRTQIDLSRAEKDNLRGRVNLPIPLSPLEKLRQSFLLRQQKSLNEAFENTAVLTPTKLNTTVANRFLNELELGSGSPIFVFHGTNITNYDSIFKHGLLVPNQSDNPITVGVKNGSAYGVGIYTSVTPHVSASYARGGQSMLVCAAIEKRSATSRHYARHGNYLVLFNSAHVLPLFVLNWTTLKTSPYYSGTSHQPGNYKARERYQAAAKSFTVTARDRGFARNGAVFSKAHKKINDLKRAVKLRKKQASKLRSQKRCRHRSLKYGY
jgi:hypothetical protein